MFRISLIRYSNSSVVERLAYHLSVSEAVDGDDSVAFVGKDLDLVAPAVPEIREPVDQEEHRASRIPFLYKVFLFERRKIFVRSVAQGTQTKGSR